MSNPNTHLTLFVFPLSRYSITYRISLLSSFVVWFSFVSGQVEEGQTVLVMNEPDLSEDMDGWTEWYKHITEAVERLKLELDERF